MGYQSGINKREGEDIGLFDTVISQKDYLGEDEGKGKALVNNPNK